jgi:hypothetical protein
MAQDRELVARQSSQHVAGLEHGRHAVGELHKQVVAGVVAERVVDFFESIEVEHQHVRGQAGRRAT